MGYEAKFVEWAAVTGDSSAGAIVRLSDNDEHILSAVVRVSRTLMTSEDLTEDGLRELLPGRAVSLVADRAARDPAWVEQHRGESDARWMITDAQEWRESHSKAVTD